MNAAPVEQPAPLPLPLLPLLEVDEHHSLLDLSVLGALVFLVRRTGDKGLLPQTLLPLTAGFPMRLLPSCG